MGAASRECRQPWFAAGNWHTEGSSLSHIQWFVYSIHLTKVGLCKLAHILSSTTSVSHNSWSVSFNLSAHCFFSPCWSWWLLCFAGMKAKVPRYDKVRHSRFATTNNVKLVYTNFGANVCVLCDSKNRRSRAISGNDSVCTDECGGGGTLGCYSLQMQDLVIERILQNGLRWRVLWRYELLLLKWQSSSVMSCHVLLLVCFHHCILLDPLEHNSRVCGLMYR